MKPNILLLLLVFGALTFSNAHAASDCTNTIKKADILGGVYNHDSKKPLSHVTITVYSAQKKEKVIITDADGFYAFDDLKAGIYKFVFEKEGYKKVTREKVVVQPDSGVQLNVEMSRHTAYEYIPGPFHFTDLE